LKRKWWTRIAADERGFTRIKQTLHSLYPRPSVIIRVIRAKDGLSELQANRSRPRGDIIRRLDLWGMRESA
jgi:hypothetical protein